MTRAPCSAGASIEDFEDEALISEAVRRGLIASRLEDWPPRARRILASLEWTKAATAARRASLRPYQPLAHPFGMAADADSR